MSYLNSFSTRVTRQSEAIPGTAQVPNSAGGHTWAVDDWTRLQRFLVLGTEGGTYYTGERKLTKENAAAVMRCIKADGPKTVAMIESVSDGGRAPKNDPALFALAMAASVGDLTTKRLAFVALPKVARIGTHLEHFAAYMEQFRGWGKLPTTGVSNWFNMMPAEKLAYQAIKYQSRDKWALRDILRLAHPVPRSNEHCEVFKWITKGWEDVGPDAPSVEALRQIWAFEQAKRATTARQVASLIREYNLPREAVPTTFLSDLAVWDALLQKMPLTAMIRNLGTMSKVGLLKTGTDAETTVLKALGDADYLKRSRVHPIAVLSALKVYAQGHGERSGATWAPAVRVIDALDGAFYKAFGNVEPTGKRTLVALDISGSMESGVIAGVPGLTPRVGSAAMALVTMAVEPNWACVGFTAGTGNTGWVSPTRTGWRGHGAISVLTISPQQRLDDVVKYVQCLPFAGTDCSLPMLWALATGAKVDTFIIYTDSETWAGNIHPSQALRQYREKTGIPAKLIVVGMVSNGFTIADPNDGGMLDVVGFDTAAPQVMSDFARG